MCIHIVRPLPGYSQEEPLVWVNWHHPVCLFDGISEISCSWADQYMVFVASCLFNRGVPDVWACILHLPRHKPEVRQTKLPINRF